MLLLLGSLPAACQIRPSGVGLHPSCRDLANAGIHAVQQRGLASTIVSIELDDRCSDAWVTVRGVDAAGILHWEKLHYSSDGHAESLMQLTMTDSRVLEYFRILHRYMALLGDHPREEQSVPPRYIVSHPRQRNVIVDGREVHARWKGGLFEHAMFLSYLAGMAPSDALREQIDYAGTDQESVRRTVEFWLDQVSALGDHAIEESMMMEFDATVILHAALQSGPAPASP